MTSKETEVENKECVAENFWGCPCRECRSTRVDDGLPAELDGLKLSKSKHRNERLKSLGNAIVPKVAAQIMKAIKSYPQPIEPKE